MGADIWAELGATLRAMRLSGGMSLRQAELATGRNRGNLSLVETGRTRPSRELVEWYDETFAGDGLALTTFAEALVGQVEPRMGVPAVVLGSRRPDHYSVVGRSVAHGQLVPPGSETLAAWTLWNIGETTWQGRLVRRIGAPAGARLLRSAPTTTVPDCPPGERVSIAVPVTIPDLTATYAAYWRMTEADGTPCFAHQIVLDLVVVADPHAQPVEGPAAREA
ncbi:MAG: NBR1-Ig-like domain-containing protein [Jatrophihabitans sp.]|uniref:NBR1-Ig-like domain-containing protein n=1 Tax=Jatrophihabitans sp. TaxID=1932789 RepID=UPI003F7E2E4A